MTATAGLLLTDHILPLIASAIARGAVKPVGTDDVEELQAEGIALAAALLDSAEARGKQVSASSVAFYALQGLKSGRRSGYAGRADAMSAAAILDGAVHIRSMDAAMQPDEDDPDQDLTLHDLIAASNEDPATEAGRNVDWDTALDTMDDRMRGVLAGTAEGVGTGEMALRYRVSPPRICQVREAAGDKIQAVWGGNPIKDATRQAAWTKHVRTYAQRRACRAERAAAWKSR
jgi:hypothetical protein